MRVFWINKWIVFDYQFINYYCSSIKVVVIRLLKVCSSVEVCKNLLFFRLACSFAENLIMS